MNEAQKRFLKEAIEEMQDRLARIVEQCAVAKCRYDDLAEAVREGEADIAALKEGLEE